MHLLLKSSTNKWKRKKETDGQRGRSQNNRKQNLKNIVNVSKYVVTFLSFNTDVNRETLEVSRSFVT